MKKVSLILLIALALAMLTNMAYVEASPASIESDKDVQRVGLVVAYTADQSITIMDRDGVQYTFTIAPNLKVVPPQRANMLGVGAYVTIIAPNNVPDGKSIATGIVIHPQPPASFPLPTASFTPLPTDTAVSTETALPTEVASETLTETPTEVPSETPTTSETLTETPTSQGTATETATPTETSGVTSLSQPNTRVAVTSFIEWLAGLFRQFLTKS
jgi:hypothetical protein